jgi:hypothetical protein
MCWFLAHGIQRPARGEDAHARPPGDTSTQVRKYGLDISYCEKKVLMVHKILREIAANARYEPNKGFPLSTVQAPVFGSWVLGQAFDRLAAIWASCSRLYSSLRSGHWIMRRTAIDVGYMYFVGVAVSHIMVALQHRLWYRLSCSLELGDRAQVFEMAQRIISCGSRVWTPVTEGPGYGSEWVE